MWNSDAAGGISYGSWKAVRMPKTGEAWEVTDPLVTELLVVMKVLTRIW